MNYINEMNNYLDKNKSLPLTYEMSLSFIEKDKSAAHIPKLLKGYFDVGILVNSHICFCVPAYVCPCFPPPLLSSSTDQEVARAEDNLRFLLLPHMQSESSSSYCRVFQETLVFILGK